MELDFSALEGLNKATGSPTDALKGAGGSNISLKASKSVEGTTDALEQEEEGKPSGLKKALTKRGGLDNVKEWKPKEGQAALAKLGGKQEAYNKYVEVCKEYQENTKKTEIIRTALRQRARHGALAYDLLMLALEGLELTTGDKTLSQQVMSWVRD